MVDSTFIVTEWEPADLPQPVAALARTAIADLKDVLQPRISQIKTQPGGMTTIRNLLGSVRLPSGDALHVQPRHDVDDRWAESIAQLLDDGTRIAVSGHQRSSQNPRRNDLVTAVAAEYANRLDAALRRVGPIEAYRREQRSSSRLSGHLRVSQWLRTVALNPAVFPIEYDSFTTSNDFSIALAKVAWVLAISSRNGGVSSRLRALERQLLPGQPPATVINPAIASRPLPPQWSAFRPAWDIAAAVLRNRSVVGDPGSVAGLEVAVEPWPLLEVLLQRTLRSFAQQSNGEYELVPKRQYQLLTQAEDNVQSVEPDGLLARNSMPAVSFEAKYTTWTRPPHRSHVFQTLTTAASLNTPTAVLVYPGDDPLRLYTVKGFAGRPSRLATLGLSMFTYTRGTGDVQRGQQVAALLDQVVQATAPTD
ncbi:MAG: hypothetical protein E6R06_19935 [Mycobacterium sp.]|nr:MAG: hypothetical protein E6R06_19935 [Mycobacterium sp.]